MPTGKERLLVYHIGSLGDTLMAVPALWALRYAFPHARRVLLTKRTPRRESVLGHSLFHGTDMFQDLLMYAGERYLDRRITRYAAWLALIARIRAGRFSTVVYLAPSDRSPEQTERDRRFFQLCGIPRLIGFDWVAPAETRERNAPLPRLARESEFLLQRLTSSGVNLPSPDQLRHDLDLGHAEQTQVNSWLKTQRDDGGRPWVAFAAGSNMPSKLWPEANYQALGHKLIAGANIWPVFFGGPEDRALGERLLNSWGCGANAAGALSPRAAGAALRNCRLFIGNDTGTMHLAASEEVRCLAIFSARDFPGKWYPIGDRHVIVRRAPTCEGCMLEVCKHVSGTPCLDDIGVDEVGDIALRLLNEA